MTQAETLARLARMAEKYPPSPSSLHPNREADLAAFRAWLAERRDQPHICTIGQIEREFDRRFPLGPKET